MRVLKSQKGSGDLSLIVNDYMPALRYYEAIYREIHLNPELSSQETETAAVVAKHLRQLGYEVLTGIGGTGVVGILHNGAETSQTILLRSELDALPVLEETGLPYASKKRMRDGSGEDVPVMHACGHDMHIASLLAAADLLISAKSRWIGTLLILFQPAEEGINGAQGMVDDGLYDKIPVPDILLGQHLGPFGAGDLGVAAGPQGSSMDSLNVRIFGRGGHGSMPNRCIDPVVIAAYIIVRLQSIVSREVDPMQPAVVTCGKIQAGTAGNIIPEWADMTLDVRTFDEKVRDEIIAAIRRIVKAECDASGLEEEPLITLVGSSPVLASDKLLAEELRGVFKDHFSGEVYNVEKGMGSEDFMKLALPIKKPYVFWGFGGIDRQQWDDAVKHGKEGDFPSNHSSKFAPVIQPTLKTGVSALAIAALRFFQA